GRALARRGRRASPPRAGGRGAVPGGGGRAGLPPRPPLRRAPAVVTALPGTAMSRRLSSGMTAMRKRRIGSLQVSVVGLGCNNFGGRLDEAATRSVVDAALDAGVDFLDTADTYGGTDSETF